MIRSLWRLRFSRSVPFAVVVAVLAGQADGQITTQMLIGDSVSEVGSKYPDVDQAIQRFSNRDVPGARLLLEEAKRKDPALPPTDVTLAKLYFLSGNAAAGRASLEKTALEVPGDPEAYLILADQAIRQGRFIEGESLNDKALQLIEKFSQNPKRKRNFQIAARAGRASVYERRRDWPAAAADLQELLKVDPDNAAAHYRLGQALFLQKKFSPGYEEFKIAREKDKNKVYPLPDVAAALMYDQLAKEDPKMQEKAQQFFDRAIAANKSDPATLIAYGQWLIKNGSEASLKKAETVLADARKANPEVLNLHILSGIAARMNKQLKPAEDHFMEALRISPANADTLNQLALLLIDQAEPAKRQRALEFAGISSRLNNQSADAQVTFAWVLFQHGRNADAEQALREAIQLGNLSPDSRYLVAKMLADRNQAAAKQILQEALDAETGVIFVNRQEAKALLDSLGS
ncbi:MAG: tetratricopeptide repeat protein [Planctomycetes bacterium]|nr:tetratricopeptide repeat protein [Planctomycetota bacterium]